MRDAEAARKRYIMHKRFKCAESVAFELLQVNLYLLGVLVGYVTGALVTPERFRSGEMGSISAVKIS